MKNDSLLPPHRRPLPEELLTNEEFYRSLPIFDMFPLSNGDDHHIYAYSLLYAVLFIVGVCGNVCAITLIKHMHSGAPFDNTMIYILFLCCVDLASVVPLPMAIMDQLLGFWMFGTILCKLYRTLEHLGRALSTFALAAMAFDRFFRVRFPQHKEKMSQCMVILQLFILSGLTFALLTPLLIKASSEEIVLREVLLENPYRLARVRVILFCFGFFFPVVLIIIFYSAMLRTLFKSTPKHLNNTNTAKQISLTPTDFYAIAVSVFFILCWLPYWSSMLYLNYLHWNQDLEVAEQSAFPLEKFIYLVYAIHALPYLNSASNWLFYVLLYGQLMRRVNTKQVVEIVCSMPMGTDKATSTQQHSEIPLQSLHQQQSSSALFDEFEVTITEQHQFSATETSSSYNKSPPQFFFFGGNNSNRIEQLLTVPNHSSAQLVSLSASSSSEVDGTGRTIHSPFNRPLSEGRNNVFRRIGSSGSRMFSGSFENTQQTLRHFDTFL